LSPNNCSYIITQELGRARIKKWHSSSFDAKKGSYSVFS